MHKVVGIIGYPLGHTLSPAMHNAAFLHFHLDYEYVPFEVPPAELAEAVGGLRALHIAGFNVTIPHKEAILPLLDDVTKVAKIIGAVNTVKNQEGRLIGYNTDGAGFIDSLKEDAGFDPKGKKVLILGAGGAARAVAVMLAEANAKALTIYDVQTAKAAALTDYVGSFFEIKTQAVKVLPREFSGFDLLVNASPIGMHPCTDESPLAKEAGFSPGLVVYDLVYNPAETKLTRAAKAAGCRAFSGLGMLVRQGALSFTIWTGAEAPLATMFKAAREALGS
jgi:shikimate dehydrogenase